jgi:hypothetical protein
LSKNTYVSGQHNVTCDVCSQKTKAGLTRQRWDGFRVCCNCFEERHPQDFVRARPDKIAVPFTRPRTTDTFIPDNFTAQPSDLLNLTEVLTTTAVYLRDFADTVVFNDTVDTLGGKGFTDTITFNDNINFTRDVFDSLSDSLTFTSNVNTTTATARVIGGATIGLLTIG